MFPAGIHGQVLTASLIPAGVLAAILLLLYYSHKWYSRTTAFPEKRIIPILNRFFLFYNRLPEDKKRQFVKRVSGFISSKEFVPKEIQTVTDEMKVLISASAVQITFGLTEHFFDHFSTILVYPDVFYSRSDERMHKGQVNMRGIIVLSWKHFLDGYIDPTDGRNLGLHEMAHALRLQDQFFNPDENVFPKPLLDSWEMLATHEINKIKSGLSGFFRDYAATNNEEFFAVAVEYFFEKPEEFKDNNMQLFQLLCKLLNQNPLNYR